MADERSWVATAEHEKMLGFLKQHGSVEAETPEEESALADLAAAGFARKEVNAYIYTAKSPAAWVNTAWEVAMLTEKQKKIILVVISCVPQLIACLMLGWALKPHNPYGYYILLRWVCCAVFAYLAFKAIAQEKQGWVWVLGITAVVYNPIIQVHLTREIWSIINLIITPANKFRTTALADFAPGGIE
jgi:hypothetical protein